MASMLFLGLTALLLKLAAAGWASWLPSCFSCGETDFVSKYDTLCQIIADKMSNSSKVYYPGQRLYRKGNSHWAASSEQASTCVVEPANAEDTSIVIRLVGSTSTPFGIRSGGHTTSPGFSSTHGVQISLLKMSQVIYHPAPEADDGSAGSVEIGAGAVWDHVYKILDKHKMTVVGGRTTGVGVGGFILGGGYGWLSNQYGLAIDTVLEFEVVLPNGDITIATETENPDLFFGLKGGFNNFGIVTKFTLLAFPRKKIWGGYRIYTAVHWDRVAAATAAFIADMKDPKAGIIATFNVWGGFRTVILLMFYDGRTPPAGIFDQFPSTVLSWSNVRTRSFSSLVRASPANWTYGYRGAFDTVPLKTFSPALIEQIQDQSKYWGAKKGAKFISFDVESFTPSMTTRDRGGAYPHDEYTNPFHMYFAWANPKYDDFFIEALKESADVIRNQAIAEGQDIQGLVKYGNYASGSEDLESIYGKNLPRLQEIKRQYDPKNIMSLTGGFRL